MNESNKPAAFQVHPSSFRDPSGFVFESGGTIYRQVNLSYREHYDLLMSSGLYKQLTDQQLLLPHSEVSPGFSTTGDVYKILRPEPVEFISYSYEWCFGMLKDAALLTLKIAKIALNHGMILKDATPYNIQWHRDRLVFIDTLSFEKYVPGKPWIAYRQFCECFLGALLLMHYRKTSLHELQLAYPQGIPLQIIKKLLPVTVRFSILAYLHIHLHAKVSAKPDRTKDQQATLPKEKLVKLLSSLEMVIQSLSLRQDETTWGNYYGEASTRDDYLSQKQQLIADWVKQLTGLKKGIDLGANDGTFAEILSTSGIQTIAADGDPAAISKLYARMKSGSVKHTIPLVIDLSDPSPAGGLNNTERASFLSRVKDCDIAFCLALLHHLCIGRNIPFSRAGMMLQLLCRYLIIEFVPRTDPMVTVMLQGKPDIYTWYNEKEFTETFDGYFITLKKQIIPGTERILFLMERR